MKNIIISFFVLCLIVVDANATTLNNVEGKEPNTSQINQKDELGRKQGRWVFLGKDQPEKGYPLEGKISEGEFKDDRKNGRWIIYYKDGVTPKIEGHFENNRPNGEFTKYHPNGKIKEIGTFNKNRYVDSLKRYNEKGVLVYEGNYSEVGKEAGEIVYYYDNGKPEITYTAENGIPTNKAVRYWPNGDIKEKITYDSDGSILETSGVIETVTPAVEIKHENVKSAPKPTSIDKESFEPNAYNKIYNDDKELWMEGDFKDGLLWDGRLYVYDEDGLLLKVEVYRKGKYNSDGQL
ncbi:MAG: hypothetical protein WEA99_03760 [Brumimicrobium sp.]